AKKKDQACHIKPQHQDDCGPQRSVSFAVGVKEMKIDSESDRCDKPEQHANDRTRRNPVPVLLLDVRAEVVNQRERSRQRDESQKPLSKFPGYQCKAAEAEFVGDNLGKLASEEHQSQRK